MRLLAPLARRLMRREFVLQAVRERADLSVFRRRPSWRLIFGLTLITLSMLMGWPSVGVLGVMAAVIQEPLLFLVGGPVTYGLSWIVWLVGMWIAGPDNYNYGRVFLRWGLRGLVEKSLGRQQIAELLSSADHGENSPS